MGADAGEPAPADIESPYVRREPSEARANFAEAGRTGAFWGLDEEHGRR